MNELLEIAIGTLLAYIVLFSVAFWWLIREGYLPPLRKKVMDKEIPDLKFEVDHVDITEKDGEIIADVYMKVTKPVEHITATFIVTPNNDPREQ